MSSGARDLRRKMRRTLQLTIQGEFGLTEGEAWWLDHAEMTFWCPEQLVEGHLHAIRVDLLQQGGTVDIKARISEVYSRKQAHIRHGCIHVALYETNRAQDRKSLDELIERLNPDPDASKASMTSVAGASVSSTTSRASKAKRRIAENRARRRRAASQMPDTGSRLDVEHKGSDESSVAAEAAAPAAEETPSASSSSSSSSTSRSRSQAGRRREAPPPAPPEPESVQPPEPEPEPAPEPEPRSASESRPGHRPKKRRRKKPQVSREDRDARHRARMAALGSSGTPSRSRSSASDRRGSRDRRDADTPQAEPTTSSSRSRRSRPPERQKPRSPSEFIRHRRRGDGRSEHDEPQDRRDQRPRRQSDRMPDPQAAPTGAAMVPVSGMLSPGDPPSVFVRFADPGQVRGAVHGDSPRPRCLVEGVSGLTASDRVAAAFQLPNQAFVQLAGKVLAIDGDRATLELSSQNPADIASLLAARRS